MQAQLTLRRFPSTFFVVLLAIAAALLLGGTLGYVLKPAGGVTPPTRVVVVHDESLLYGTGEASPAVVDRCEWVNHVKAC